MKHRDFLQQLPAECQDVEIAERHKIELKPFFLKEGVWVVLLTDMPGEADKAWHLTWAEWRKVDPKHETRIRWIREHCEPTFVSEPNTQRKPKLLQLLLF